MKNDLYAYALSMGLTGITMSGDTLYITSNFSGQPVGVVSISAETANGSPQSFIDMSLTVV